MRRRIKGKRNDVAFHVLFCTIFFVKRKFSQRRKKKRREANPFLGACDVRTEGPEDNYGSECGWEMPIRYTWKCETFFFLALCPTNDFDSLNWKKEEEEEENSCSSSKALLILCFSNPFANNEISRLHKLLGQPWLFWHLNITRSLNPGLYSL